MTQLNELLSIYYQNCTSAEDSTIAGEFAQFAYRSSVGSSDGFLRSHLPGHFTASGLVVDPSHSRVCLVFHQKLNKWLQPGGHADGNPDLLQVALKEVEEETGLRKLEIKPLGPSLIFDLDRHAIAETLKEPAHFHYDVRFLVVADPTEALAISDESSDLAWFSIKEARRLNPERSMQRMYDKAQRSRQT